ncbi:MAG: hydrolase [Rickettsiales bacterium]|nr:hydrolase [Rickettsiales bacterium]
MNLQRFQPYLDAIVAQEQHLIHLTQSWSAINSGSYHLDGLARMRQALEDNFLWLQADSVERLDLPPMKNVDANGVVQEVALGQALRYRKRSNAPLQIFLGGHYDTVFAADHPFQVPRFVDGRTLNGPGAADLKGGLVVMLKALEALEASPWKEALGWEILLNPDEEIGSVGSAPLLREAASRNHLGLVYEPALADGTLAGERKGSGNFHLVVTGRAAHAGREHAAGRNAVVLAAELTVALSRLTSAMEGITVNPARIEGGAALNVVPDTAIVRFNVRVANQQEQQFVEQELHTLMSKAGAREGYSVALHGGFGRPPKSMTPAWQQMQKAVEECGKMLGQSVQWQATGGCCDGNNLAAHGLPNIDTLGVRGGNIHSDREFVLLDSLVERAQLSALLLMRMATGEIQWNPI